MTDFQNLSAAEPLKDVEFTQKRNGNQTRFAFGEDELVYTIVEKNGSNTVQVKYNEISRTRDYFVERNTWLQNVGLLWIVLGAAFTAMNFYAERPSMSMWLPIGAACFAFAWFRTTRYTKVPTERGTLFIIDDEQKDAILVALDARRSDQLRRWYDFLAPDEDPGRQRARYQWLHKEAVLSDEQLAQRLTALDLHFADGPVVQIAGELADDSAGSRRRLN